VEWNLVPAQPKCRGGLLIPPKCHASTFQVRMRHAGAALEVKNGISHSTARYLPNECDRRHVRAGSNSMSINVLDGSDQNFEGVISGRFDSTCVGHSEGPFQQNVQTKSSICKVDYAYCWPAPVVQEHRWPIGKDTSLVPVSKTTSFRFRSYNCKPRRRRGSNKHCCRLRNGRISQLAKRI
jgi:hypothetical protein